MMWTVLTAFSLLGCLTSVNSQLVCKDEGDIRIVGGNPLEGIVEVCFDQEWGVICADNWDTMDAAAVCRQLGFSSDNTSSSRISNSTPRPTHLDEVSCEGSEERLNDCPFNRIIECEASLEAGVNCQPNPPKNVVTSAAETSVLITWQPPGVTLPDHYNIELAYEQISNSTNLTYVTVIQVPGTDTRLEYDRLFPQQIYSCCVSAVYGPRNSSSCQTFQTESSGRNYDSLWMYIMGGIMGLLAFLLMLTGVGLAYPRCIRPKMKDKKCLSSISRFLDKKIYMTRSSAYNIQNPPPRPSTELIDVNMAGNKDRGNFCESSYDPVDFAPPIPSHETAKRVEYADIIVTHHASIS